MTDDAPEGEFTIREVIALLPEAYQDTILQMAVFENAVDHNESGTPLWENMPEDAHTIYLIETHRRVMAMVALGWSPYRHTEGEEDE